MLEYGLCACEATLDSKLATDLVHRAVSYSPPMMSSAAIASHFATAISVCAKSLDSISLRAVLESLDHAGDKIPLESKRNLLEHGVLAFADLQNPEMAEALLLAMAGRNSVIR